MKLTLTSKWAEVMNAIFFVILFLIGSSPSKADDFEDMLGQMQGTFTLASWQSKIETQMKNEPKVAEQQEGKPGKKWDWKRFFTSMKPTTKESSLKGEELDSVIPSKIYLTSNPKEAYPAALVVKSRPSGLSQFHLIHRPGFSLEQPVMEKGTGEIFVVIDNYPFEAYLCARRDKNNQLIKESVEMAFISRRADKMKMKFLNECIRYKQQELFPKNCES